MLVLLRGHLELFASADQVWPVDFFGDASSREDGSANAIAAHGEVDAGARTATGTDTTGGRGDGAGASAASCSGCGDCVMASTVVSCGEEGDGRQGCVLLQLLVVEDAADPRRKQRVRRRGVCAGGEVGARVRAPEEAGSLVVGPRRLLGGLERAQPHPDLLGGVLDLSHPPPGGPLPDAHELAAAATAFGSHFGLGFLCDWQLVAALLLGMALWLLLELELHWEEEIEGNVSLQVF